jgi:hypothetical protein
MRGEGLEAFASANPSLPLLLKASLLQPVRWQVRCLQSVLMRLVRHLYLLLPFTREDSALLKSSPHNNPTLEDPI